MTDNNGPPQNLNDMPGHLIRRMQQKSTQTFQAGVRQAGSDITSVQFAALEAIFATPGTDQATIAATIAYDRATIGGVLQRLIGKGFVVREVSPDDRRARVLHITSTGRAELERLRPVVGALQHDILSPLSAEERATFVALARRITLGEDGGT